VHSNVQASQARASALLASLEPESVDVVLLPEMAFTGYTFRDAGHVSPLAEPVGAGPTSRWAAALAARLRCCVVAGFVEERDSRLFNSQLVLSATGLVLACHRKVHLFATDETWATEGSSWTSFSLPLCSGEAVTCALGVCMDINPKGFTAPFEAYELATAVLQAGAAVVLFSSAWCDRSPLDPPDYCPPPISVATTQQYWCERLAPLALDSETRFFVCADRVGREGATTFCGGSCAIALGRGRASLLSSLDEREEGVLLQTLDVR